MVRAQSPTVPPGSLWTAPQRPWTEADLAHLPEDGHRYEIVDGCLHVTPPYDDAHQRLTEEIVAALRSAAPPGWRPLTRTGVAVGDCRVVADAAVLRPGSPQDAAWATPADVALVVEVESPANRRYARCLKSCVYAEAEIESFWRIECTCNGPVAHLYTRAAAGHYQLHRSVQAGHCVVAELPYAVQVAPATWT
jgi:Uma2 family endonuclease